MICAVWICASAVPAVAQATTGTYNGLAYDALMNFPDLHLNNEIINMVGPLPPGGGTDSNTVLDSKMDGCGTVAMLMASVSGDDTGGQSSAAAGGVSLIIKGAVSLSLSLDQSSTWANASGASGTFTIADLTIDGTSYTITPVPNQVVILPGIGTAIFDEQIAQTIGAEHKFTVNALDLTVTDPHCLNGTLILGHAESEFTPAAVPEPQALVNALGLGLAASGMAWRRRRFARPQR
jgi:hypothetical protein